MHSFSMLFETEDAARRGAKRLMTKLGVTGELEMRPLPSGKWLLAVSSEKDLRDTSLDKLEGEKVDPGALALREAGT